MAKQELGFTTRLTREDVAGIVEAMIEGLKEGLLKVQKSGETLELEVPRVVDLEVEASLSPERAVFDIEVSWRCNRPEIPDTPDNVPGENPVAAPKPRQKTTADKTKAVSKSGTAKKAAPKSGTTKSAAPKARDTGKSGSKA